MAARIRHHPDRADPDPAVSGTRRALLAGLGAAVLYLAGAALSGSLSPLARRPLLDGFAPPPAYRWVSPPPALAAGNKRPASAAVSLQLDPQTGSEASVLTTSDVQVSLALSMGAFPAVEGKTSVQLSAQPLDPSRFAAPPPGWLFVGNVYRIRAAYLPGGPEAPTLRIPGLLALFYPGLPDNLLHRHTILASADGSSWRAIHTTDSAAQQQASADVRSLGYFAVAASGAGKPKTTSRGTILYYAILGVLAAGLVGLFVVAEVRHRRARRRSPKGRRR